MMRLNSTLTPHYLISTTPRTLSPKAKNILITPALYELSSYSLKELATQKTLLQQLHEKYIWEKIEHIRAKKRDNAYNGITRSDGTRLRKISSKKMIAALTTHLEKHKPYFFQFSKRRHYKVLADYLKNTLLQSWAIKKLNTFKKADMLKGVFGYDINNIRTFTQNLDRVSKNKYNAFFKHTSEIQEHLIIDASAVTRNISKEHAEALAAVMMGYKINKKTRPYIPGRIV
jgi:hypothetical protein